MYRLLVYGLSILLVGSLALSAFHKLAIPLPALVLSFSVILIAGYIASITFPLIFKATTNKESSLITSLILCCIMPPTTIVHNLALLGLVAITAVLSKYILIRHYKHLFNPAAIAALIFGLTRLLPATWWIGSPAMLALVSVFGLLVIRKIRRFQLFFFFLVTSIIAVLVIGIIHGEMTGYILSTAFQSSPLIFLGSIMLTEPSTTPPRIWQQRIYGVIVGIIYSSQLNFGFISASPEAALIIGNIFSYFMSPKYKLKLKLSSKRNIAPDIFEFGFKSASNINFLPGQYLEWTIDLPHNDRRGNRRTFSIASAPHDDEINIVIRVAPNKGSRFKERLLKLNIGDNVMAGQLAGDFVLPDDKEQKLVFMAGGIGITPFLSMVKTLIKNGEKRNIVLFYVVSRENDFCFQEVWKQASILGINTIPVLTADDIPETWKGRTGRIDQASLIKLVPDLKTRKFYISGPPGFVDGNISMLGHSGISRSSIFTDHFAGY